MTVWKYALSALGAALVLVGCGGGGGSATSTGTPITSMVSFGDSLSDAGTLKVGAIAAAGGGRWTINAPDAKIWVDLLSAQLGLPAPCAAQTGFNSLIPTLPAVTTTFKIECTNYAQGGSRVTNPVGPGNNGLLPASEGYLGQPTTPVITQINNHLAKVGKFNGTEMVTVLAGGNDIFRQSADIPAAVLAFATAGDPIPLATQKASAIAVTNMGIAGAELAGYVKSLILAKGAKYVVVVNLPNVGVTPYAVKGELTTPGTVAIATAMAQAFNSQLAVGLSGVPGVKIVDFYSEITKIVSDPVYRAQVGVTNAATPACSADPLKNPLEGRALLCSAANLAVADPKGYLFADDVHPTPLGHKLLAQRVILDLTVAGWL